MTRTLNSNDKHLMRLCRRGADETGWAKVSTMVLPFVKQIPGELITVEETDGGARARLTDRGNTVLDWI